MLNLISSLDWPAIVVCGMVILISKVEGLFQTVGGQLIHVLLFFFVLFTGSIIEGGINYDHINSIGIFGYCDVITLYNNRHYLAGYINCFGMCVN